MERTLAAGQPADVTIFSTDREWTYDVKDSPSKSRNSPFDGREFKGGPMATIVGRQSHLEAVVAWRAAQLQLDNARFFRLKSQKRNPCRASSCE